LKKKTLEKSYKNQRKPWKKLLRISEKNKQTFQGKALENLKKAAEKLVWNLFLPSPFPRKIQ
jgi:hypothetical protein